MNIPFNGNPIVRLVAPDHLTDPARDFGKAASQLVLDTYNRKVLELQIAAAEELSRIASIPVCFSTEFHPEHHHLKAKQIRLLEQLQEKEKSSWNDFCESGQAAINAHFDIGED